MVEPLTEETLREIVALVRAIERNGEGLPPAARAAYLEAKRSIVDAHRKTLPALSW